MIYEKKHASLVKICENIPVESDDNTLVQGNGDKTPLTTEIPSAIQSEYVANRHIGGCVKPYRKKRRFVRHIPIFTLVVLFVFAADMKLFGGKASGMMLSAAKNIVSGHTEEKAYDSREPLIPERTIYTIPFSEPDVSPQNTAENISESEQTHPDTAEAIAVSENASQSMLDGVKYFPITSLDLSSGDIFALSNETGFNIDLREISKNTPKSLESISVTDKPLVLILHTHGCESYSDFEDSYPENAPTRSTDNSKNITRVGKKIAETLLEFGISSVHCDTLHDKDSFINAYNESAKTVKEYLEEYPSIKFVIDVHRDAVIRDDGESIKAVADISGEKYAQIMFVVGTNQTGHNHPEWKENLCLAVKLQENISETFPGLCRNINLRNVPFNQQLSCGYLLLEIGTSANMLDEALLSARAFGQELARTILEQHKEV